MMDDIKKYIQQIIQHEYYKHKWFVRKSKTDAPSLWATIYYVRNIAKHQSIQITDAQIEKIAYAQMDQCINENIAVYNSERRF